MLQVWNNPAEQQQQQQHQHQHQQLQQQQHQDNMSNILNMTSRGLPRFNLLNTSSSGLKDINLSASTNSLMIPDIFINNNNNSSNNEQPKLNSSTKGFDFITKTINEISNEQKTYQPFEIIPVKNINNNNNSNNNNISEFGVLNTSFSLDPNKIEELRLNPSVLDPFLTLPYNTATSTTNNNNSIQKKLNSGNNLTGIISTTAPISGPIRVIQTFEKESVPSPTTFSLNKEELNTITSAEMNAYVKQASIVKDLTQTEKKELKRQKRLIKNRESAHLSRQRKRERLTDLEHRVEELTTNSADITKTLSGLENENLILKAEVSQLFEVINDSPVLSALFYTLYSQTHQQQKESIETY
ncbi:hypothetical protein DICPUDRAFT_41441 [Dictyostelium purpureum]|uniref:BZIP domain-containing protein n=1 Tax=Dictyostelium purpureum TaxID=5786 RepID=F1A041_DICPU|nr:uncharacterized protein DICPUDRAFT_41441 [Dictyostelium purpureum]EGC30439.1 hypothetical protein DICPUDRAFT_41441 [Dictyostelium purpureum]|eukprot:XP_003293039.1 hypothetical protein DICPUDRAFT_41441 [Dictyostelium purpureum]